MPRVCAISGKRTTIGRQYSRRGLAKKKGGVGKKINGRTVRMKVAAKFIRRGMVQKPSRRSHGAEPTA